MSDQQQHINPWADKLQQAPLPDADASWKGMERLLDQHLPVDHKEKKRRFFFLLFPALLVLTAIGLFIGYSYYTGHKQRGDVISSVAATSNGSNYSETKKPAANNAQEQPISLQGGEMETGASIVSDRAFVNDVADTVVRNKGVYSEAKWKQGTDDNELAVGLPSSNNKVTTATGISNKENNTSTGKDKGNRSISATTITDAGHSPLTVKYTDGNKPIGRAKEVNDFGKRENNRASKANLTKRKIKAGQKSQTVSGQSLTQKTVTNRLKSTPEETGHDTAVTDTEKISLRTNTLSPFRIPSDPLAKLIIKDSLEKLTGSALSDRVLQQLKQKTPEEIKRGWTFGIGLNHFIRINNQTQAPYKTQAKSADSEGLTGKLADYLPIPQARYYFNNKLFVQGELQFNAPQFTQKVVFEQKTYQESNFTVNDTAYLKKLTYFNLPVSAHYSVFKNLYIGAGVQFSRLNSAVVLSEQSRTRIGSQFPDSSIKSIKQQRINNDTLFQRVHTNEFRLLGDVNYQAGRLTLGVRYNYALNDLMKVPVASGSITQTRNHSLQLYLRYRFLDKRKTVRPKSK